MEAKTAQLRVKEMGRRGRIITSYGPAGTVFWETPTRARMLLESDAFDLLNASTIAPAVGPSVTKPAGPVEKKSSPVAPDGPSTDSAKSSESGAADASRSSEAAQVLEPKKSKPFAKRGRPAKPKA